MSNKSYNKPEWRQRHIAFMQASRIYDRTANKFTHRIVTLCGLSGHRFYDECKRYLISPEYLLSVDNDIRVIYSHMKRFCRLPASATADGFRPILSDIGLIIHRALHEQPLPAIFDFDTTNLVGNDRWWRGNEKLLQTVVMASAPEIVVMLNHTLDNVKGTPGNPHIRSDALIRHATYVESLFGKYGMKVSRLLGKDFRETARRVDVTGQERIENEYVGAFDIYRSHDKTLRMATLRFSITKRGQIGRIDHETRS